MQYRLLFAFDLAILTQIIEGESGLRVEASKIPHLEQTIVRLETDTKKKDRELMESKEMMKEHEMARLRLEGLLSEVTSERDKEVALSTERSAQVVSLEGVLVEERRQGEERREEARMTLKMTTERAFKEKERMVLRAEKMQEELVQFSNGKEVLEEDMRRLEATKVEMRREHDRLVLLIEGDGGGGSSGMRHQAARVGPLERRVKEMEEESKQLTKEIQELDAAGVQAREETTTVRGKLEDVLERLERMSLDSAREMTELRATHQKNDTMHRLQMTEALRDQRKAEEMNMTKTREKKKKKKFFAYFERRYYFLLFARPLKTHFLFFFTIVLLLGSIFFR